MVFLHADLFSKRWVTCRSLLLDDREVRRNVWRGTDTDTGSRWVGGRGPGFQA